MRLFFALWPPPAAAAALGEWALQACRATGGRAVPRERIHLTLAFLGEVEEGRVEILKALSFARGGFPLPMEQARRWRRNGIVWAGPGETPTPLAQLVRALGRDLAEKKFELEERSFSAHVTLVRDSTRDAPLPPLPALGWPVAEATLVRSTLRAPGPEYEVLARYPLG